MRQKGYTLIELMMAVMIVSILASIIQPKYAQLTTNAYQSKAKSNLGSIRSAISLYYTEQEGSWPLKNYPAGAILDGNSLTTVLTPRYIATVPIPKLMDSMPGYNVSIGVPYDTNAISLMTQNPVLDVWIVPGFAPGWTPGVEGPYAFDNESGAVYYANDNWDITGNHYFYEW